MARPVNNFLQRHTLLRRAVLAVVVFFCFRAAKLEFAATQLYQEVIRWPSAQASIKSSTVANSAYSWSGRRNRYCPMLEYSYSLKGREYTGHNGVFDFVCWPEATDFVAQHQPGTLVKIAYDPTNPSVTIIPDAVRDPGYPWGDIGGGTIFSLILLADFLGGRKASSNGTTTE